MVAYISWNSKREQYLLLTVRRRVNPSRPQLSTDSYTLIQHRPDIKTKSVLPDLDIYAALTVLLICVFRCELGKQKIFTGYLGGIPDRSSLIFLLLAYIYDPSQWCGRVSVRRHFRPLTPVNPARLSSKIVYAGKTNQCVVFLCLVFCSLFN